MNLLAAAASRSPYKTFMEKKVLYIEDEPYLSRIVQETLSTRGYNVLHKKDGTQLSETVKSFAPDICLLDVMLPHIDGFTLANMMRNLFPELPVIFLTAKSQPQDIVQGFAVGANDYLRKPFSMEELMARIDNQLRLTQKKSDSEPKLPEEIALGSFLFYPQKMELQDAHSLKRLSQRENHILSLLCLHRDKALDRRTILQTVWGDDSFFNSRNLDVYIRKLRAHFSADESIQIITLKGQGYLFICGK